MPDYVTHVNPDFAIVHSVDIQGGYHQVLTVTDRNNIPVDKRVVGMVVTYQDAGDFITKRYEGSDVLDVNWNNDLNWISIGSTEITAGTNVVVTGDGSAATPYVVNVPSLNDADADPANEIQDISTNSSSGNISISDGSTLTLNVDDADADPSNEIQTLSVNSGTIGHVEISSGNSVIVNVGDADPTNELQNINEVTNFGNDLLGNKITGSGMPTATTDLTTKSYVDGLAPPPGTANGQMLRWNGSAWETPSVNDFNFTSAGRLGIGGIPSDMLHVVGNSGTAGNVEARISNSASSGDSRITLANNSSRELVMQLTGSGHGAPNFSVIASNGGSDIMFLTDGTVASGGTSSIIFQTGGYASTNEAFRVLPNSNIGFGLTNPINLAGFAGGVCIGSGDAGVVTAPTDGIHSEGVVNSEEYFTTADNKAVMSDENNVYLGDCRYPTGTVYNNVFAGDLAGNTSSGGNNVFLGGYAGTNCQSAGNVFIGYSAGRTTSGSTLNNVFIGNQSGRYTSTGDHNTFLGNNSGYANNTGSNNTFLGHGTGFDNTEGYSNVFLGTDAGSSNVGGDNNVAIGHQSYLRGTSSNNNVLIGSGSGSGSGIGSDNVVIGYRDGEATTSDYSVYVGSFSGFTADGEGNTFIGARSGEQINNGDNNLFAGFFTAYSKTSGGQNIFLGSYSGYGNTSGSGNVFIGYQAGYNETGSQRLYIDNTSTSSPLVYGEFDNDRITINNILKVGDRTTEPTSAEEGDIIRLKNHATLDDGYYVYNGTSWQAITTW